MEAAERHALGAHFTSEADIQRIVGPTIIRPWRDRIDAAKSATELLAIRRDLMKFRVLDPACGSGHFLIAAAERMAMHLARLRTGDDEPNTLDVQHAKRDIIGRCIYGVDLSPGLF